MQITVDQTPVWITYFNQADCDEHNQNEEFSDNLYEPGFYWAVCFPGCIPESDFYGPFSNEEEAEHNAEEILTW